MGRGVGLAEAGFDSAVRFAHVLAQPASGRGAHVLAQPASGRGAHVLAQPASGRGAHVLAQPASGRGARGLAQPASGRGVRGLAQPASGRGVRGLAQPACGVKSRGLLVCFPPTAGRDGSVPRLGSAGRLLPWSYPGWSRRAGNRPRLIAEARFSGVRQAKTWVVESSSRVFCDRCPGSCRGARLPARS